MNLLYLSFIYNRPSGVLNKLHGQVKTFEKHFENVYYTCVYEGRLSVSLKNKEVLRISKDTSIIPKHGDRKSYYNELLKFILQNDIKIIYIRYKLSDPFFIKFIKKCNKAEVKIFLEFPTYPYKNEFKSITAKTIDYFYARKLCKYVSYAITFSKDNKIFNISTINTKNGIDLDSIPLKKSKLIGKNKLHLLGVANVNLWHGFDRIIEGLHKYYKNEPELEVTFSIVGSGNEINKLQEMTNKYKLNDYISFRGFLDGKLLNEEFNNADIGIGSLGIHRLKLDQVSTLKTQEYWARGLPFIISYEELEIESIIPNYILKVGANDSPISIEKVIRFHKNVNKNPDFNIQMRNQSLETVTWDNRLKDVIDKMIN